MTQDASRMRTLAAQVWVAGATWVWSCMGADEAERARCQDTAGRAAKTRRREFDTHFFAFALL
jgi:hypothetical protein